jgi:hypothetical protein
MLLKIIRLIILKRHSLLITVSENINPAIKYMTFMQHKLFWDV